MKRLLTSILILTINVCLGQNNVLNTWAFHEHEDTNVFISIGAIDRTLQSDISAGKWFDGTTKRPVVSAFDLRNRELLNISYSTPGAEIGFSTELTSFHDRTMGGDEFNGLFRGVYTNDTLRIGTLEDTRFSQVSHNLKFTRKLGHTIGQIIISGHQINSFQNGFIEGQIIKNGENYEGRYTANSFRLNNQLSYLGTVEDQLEKNLSWGDSVRITTIVNTPLIPSLGMRVIHRPTEFTEFQLLISGLSNNKARTLKYQSDSINFQCIPTGIPTYNLFAEEEILTLNNQFEYRRNKLTESDSSISMNIVPFKAYLAYRVQIEPLVFLNFSGGYERVLNTEYYIVNFLAERKYQNDLHLQLGISNYIYNQTVKPNLSAGIRAKISDRLTLMAYTSAATSLPFLSYETVPRWTNRYHLSATLQYQLL